MRASAPTAATSVGCAVAAWYERTRTSRDSGGKDSRARRGSGGSVVCAATANATRAARNTRLETEAKTEPNRPLHVRRVGQRRAAGDARDLTERARGDAGLRVGVHVVIEDIARLA